jgi:arylsulfatase A
MITSPLTNYQRSNFGSMLQRHFLCLAFVLFSLVWFQIPGTAANRPNVVIILADDLGIGDVSCYNENAAWETPNIDQLAASGMSFTDAHTSAALCTPTRYGIMTGRYNWRSTLKSGGYSSYSTPLIENERTTIADLFKGHGYHTAIIGKWHLGLNWQFDGSKEVAYDGKVVPVIDFSQAVKNGPEAQGFMYSFGIMASLSSPPYVWVENSKPTSIPTKTSVNYDEKAFWRKGLKADDFNHVDVLPTIADKSVKYIQKQAGNKQPFFLHVALTAPHAPVIPTTEFIGKSNANAYGDFVLLVDQVVGQIVDAITGDKRLENTLIFFTSDNGQSPRADFDDDELPLAGHNGSYIYRGKKFDIFEGGHRVPFIATWPGKIRRGVKSGETICTVDFMATSADLLGVDLADDTAEDSYSILPVLKQEDFGKPLREATVHHSNDGRFAIRQGDWKLILWPGSGGWAFPATEEDMKGLPRFQLYNLLKDPGETTNLVSQYPKIVNELKALLTKYVNDGRSTPGTPQENDGPARWAELEWMD